MAELGGIISQIAGNQVNPFDVGLRMADQRAQRERYQLQTQQLENDAARRDQFQKDAANAVQSGSQADIAKLMVQYPEFREHLGAGLNAMTDIDKRNTINTLQKTVGLIQAGRPDLAAAFAQTNPDVFGPTLQVLQQNPQQFLGIAQMQLASQTDPKQLAEMAGYRSPEQLVAAQKAQLEQQAAPYGNAKTQSETEQNYAKIRQGDVRNAIEAQKATTQQQQNGVKFQQEQTDRRAAGENALASMDRMLSTIGEVQNHPGLSSSVGARVPFMNMIPGTDAANFVPLLDQLKSQGFLSEISGMKGMGALSDAEGKKLTGAIGALDQGMSEAQFRKQLNTIKSTVEAARQRAQKQYGIDPVVWEDHPQFGRVTEGRVRQAAKQAGLTYEQAIAKMRGGQ